MLFHNTGLLSWIYRWTIQIFSPKPWKADLKLHPPRLYASSCSISAVILLHLILYWLLIRSLTYSPTFYVNYHIWNLHLARWGITIHKRIKKHTTREHWNSSCQPIFIVHQMFAFQISFFVHCALCYWWLPSLISLSKQDDDADQKISDKQCDDPRESTLFTDIEDDDLDHQQALRLWSQVHWNKSLQAEWVPLPTIRSCADTFIACQAVHLSK